MKQGFADVQFDAYSFDAEHYVQWRGQAQFQPTEEKEHPCVHGYDNVPSQIHHLYYRPRLD